MQERLNAAIEALERAKELVQAALEKIENEAESSDA